MIPRAMEPIQDNHGQGECGKSIAQNDKPLVHDLYDITPEGYDLLTNSELWQRPVLDPSAEWVVGFTGPRGGGKSLEATYVLCRDYLIRGKPVFSNIPIKIELKLPNNEIVRAQSLPLDTKSFFSLANSLQGCAVLIDELELYAEARRSGSTKNLLLTYIIMQTRKRAMSFFYTIQQPQWTDNRLQFMSDVMIRSRDIANTPWGHEHDIGRGQYFSMIVEDWSGMLTGYRYHETGYSQTFCLWGVPIWGMYNSYEVVDVWDALTPVDLELNRMKISTGPQDDKDETMDIIDSKLSAMAMSGMDRVQDRVLWDMLGVDENERRGYGKMLKALGVTKAQKSDGSYDYILPKYQGEQSDGPIY